MLLRLPTRLPPVIYWHHVSALGPSAHSQNIEGLCSTADHPPTHRNLSVPPVPPSGSCRAQGGECIARQVVGRRAMSMVLPSWTPSPPPTQDPIKATCGEAAESPHCIPPKASRQASRRSRAPRTRRSRREGFAADQTELAQTSGTHGRPNHGPGRSWSLRRSPLPYGAFTPLPR